MNHVERFRQSVSRGSIDRVPLDYSATPEMTRILEKSLGYDWNSLLYGPFGIDRRSAMPVYVGPAPKRYEDGSYDNIFGVRMVDKSYGFGTYAESVHHPLAGATRIKEIERHPWPTSAQHDFTRILEPLEKYPDYAFTVGYQSIGWFSWEMRGMSQFLEDLLLEPEIADAIVCIVADLAYDYYRNIIETGKDHIGRNFVCIHLADDWATQSGLLISPTIFRTFFKRHYRRIIDLAHAAGLLVEFHCCGSVLELIPDLIDAGIDILNPVQTSATGMDPVLLKREFGKDITFSGGVDVQKVLPFYSRQEVKDEVKHLLDTLGEGGGYILAPSHAIQVGTPPENVVAMYEAAHEYYGFGMDL